MFDWFRAGGRHLSHFIISMPLYIAAPAMLVIGALDSSLLSLPEINDWLVIMRCHNQHSAVFLFPLFAAIGSVIGCWLLYTIVRRGGQAVLRARFRPEHIERVERAYAHYGFLALIVPALLPPPMPFKVFVACAGTLEFPRWRFITTVLIARGLRYYVEGILAVFYGTEVLRFLRDNGLVILSATGLVCLLGWGGYLLWNRWQVGGRPSHLGAEPSGLAEADSTSAAANPPPASTVSQ